MSTTQPARKAPRPPAKPPTAPVATEAVPESEASAAQEPETIEEVIEQETQRQIDAVDGAESIVKYEPARDGQDEAALLNARALLDAAEVAQYSMIDAMAEMASFGSMVGRDTRVALVTALTAHASYKALLARDVTEMEQF